MKKRKANDTGHEWDGIRELNNPIPVLWSFTFIFLILLAIALWFLIPSWPTLQGYFKGFGTFDQVRSDAELAEVGNEAQFTTLEKTSLEDILAKKDLRDFVLALGKSSFLINCSSCHALDGSGNKSFPVLRDSDWIWGGDIENIYATVKYGIRNTYIDSRQGEMQAFVDTGVLTKEEGNLMAKYVRRFSNKSVELSVEEIRSAKSIFAKNCATCHGNGGEGDTLQGAPNLTDNIWLYGGSQGEVYHSIAKGRAGVMPGWYEKLQDPIIKATAIYVYSLSQEKKSEVAEKE